MVDEELAAAGEKIGERFSSVGAIEDVLLFDFFPRKFAALLGYQSISIASWLSSRLEHAGVKMASRTTPQRELPGSCTYQPVPNVSDQVTRKTGYNFWLYGCAQINSC